MQHRKRERFFHISLLLVPVIVGVFLWGVWLWRESTPTNREPAQTALSLPETCFVASEDVENSRRFVFSYQDFSRLILDSNVNGPVPGEIPVTSIEHIRFLRSECITLAERAVQQGLEIAGLGQNQQVFIHEFISQQRAYCEVPVPQPEPVCDRSTFLNSSVLVSLQQDRVPPEIASDWQRLRMGAGATPGARQTRTQPVTMTAYVVMQSGQARLPRVFVLGPRGRGTQWQVLRQGYVAYLKTEPQPATLRNFDPSRPFMDQLNRYFGYWYDGYGVNAGAAQPLYQTALRDFRGLAESLYQYWMSGIDGLQDVVDETMVPQFDLRTLSNRESAIEHFINQYQRINLRRLLQTTIDVSSQGLAASSSSIADILRAASFWWTARAIQLQMGCDENGSARDVALVRQQYTHQACRHLYVTSALQGLNRYLRQGDPLRLLSAQWIELMALGSRQERAMYLQEVLPLLRAQIQAGQVPVSREWGLIAQELFQIREELQRRQVLTWLGFKNFNDRDEAILRNLQSALQSFLEEAAQYAVAHRWEQLSLYASVRRVWHWMSGSLGLPTWQQRFPERQTQHQAASSLTSSLSSMQLPAGVRDPVARIENTELLFAESVRLTRQDILLEQQVCTQWMEFFGRNWSDIAQIKRQTQGGHPYLVPATEGTCLQMVRQWVERIQSDNRDSERLNPRPSSLQRQCQNGDVLSCLSELMLLPLRSTDTPTQWASRFTVSPLPLRITRDWIIALRSRYLYGVRSDGLRSHWQQAYLDIENTWRQWAREEWQMPPSVGDFTRCIDNEEWQRLYQSSTVRLHQSSLVLNPRCPQSLRASVAHWAVRLALIIRSQENGHVWEDDPWTALVRYRLWGQRMRYASGSLAPPLRGVLFRRNFANVLINRMQSYLGSLPYGEGARPRNAPEQWWRSVFGSRSVSMSVMTESMSRLLGFYGDCEAIPSSYACRGSATVTDDLYNLR